MLLDESLDESWGAEIDARRLVATGDDWLARSKDEDLVLASKTDEDGCEIEDSIKFEETELRKTGFAVVLRTDETCVVLEYALLLVWVANVGVTDV